MSIHTLSQLKPYEKSYYEPIRINQLLTLILLGIKQLVTRVFSYHTTDKKYLYVNSDKLIVRAYILDAYTRLISNNSLTTEYHYPVTIEQLKEILV